MSHKGSSANTDISLIENDAIINDQTGVATVLNDYYVNVTKFIGQPDLLDVNEDIEDVFLAHESHESVQYIEQYMKDQNGSNKECTSMIFSLSICQVIELVMDAKMFCYISSIYVRKL